MDKIKRLLLLTFLLFFIAVPITSAKQEQEEDAVLVGRISHVEGELLRYVPENEDWVATVIDTPFGIEDLLYSNENAKAEFIIPNNTWIRIGGKTQIQAIKLENDATEVDVDSGTARFYNKSSSTVIKVTTPFGYVTAPPQTTFDLYVGEESLEVISLKGKVNFVHVTDKTGYEVIAESSSILADFKRITSIKGAVDDKWNSWNFKRDNLWEKRLAKKGDSKEYLPEGLYSEAYALEENGTWERVYYEGRYRYFWRPVYVSSSWAPFTVGRWTVWYGDHCWVPYEPFGYVTHHYGNWVYISRCWYWAPPVHFVSISVGPFFHIGFRWYPGRVAWIHRGIYVGWIPLAPYERYYCHRYWGPRSIVFNRTHININLNNYRYKHHAFIVKQKNFYAVNNYRKVRVSNIARKAVINNYRGTPVINSRVIKNFRKIDEKFNFRNIKARRKPHRSVIEKVRHNKLKVNRSLAEKGSLIQKGVMKKKPGKPFKRANVKTPITASKTISARKALKPVEKTGFKMQQLKEPRQKVQKPGAGIIPRMNVKKPEPRQKVHKLGTGIMTKPNVQKSWSRPKVRSTRPNTIRHNSLKGVRSFKATAKHPRH
jgi:hypothetical protein